MKEKSEPEFNAQNESTEEKITRKEAIRKTGLVALSATTMFLLLGSSAKGSTSSPASLPDGF